MDVKGKSVIVPFIQKHAPLVPLLLPLVPIMMIHTDMAKLIKYGYNRGVPSADDFQVGVVPGGRGHTQMLVRLWWLGVGRLGKLS